MLSGWRAIAVRGADARAWLQDLVTADVEGLGAGQSRRSLLLTPTGRIRADFHVARNRRKHLPPPPGGRAARAGRRDPRSLRALFPRRARRTEPAIGRSSPSSAAEPPRTATMASSSRLRCSASATTSSVPGRAGSGAAPTPPGTRARRGDRSRTSRRWRIRRGVARMGADFGPDALPAEAGLESTIDFTKGCFLGQESVAKVRNLGHPPRVLLPVRSEATIRPGTAVLARRGRRRGGHECRRGERRRGCDRPDPVGRGVRIALDGGRTALPTA